MKDLWIFIIATVVIVWLLQKWRDRRFIMLFTKFPANWWHLILGFGVILSSKGTLKVAYSVFQKYGKTILCYLGPYPIILTADPELIKDIFNAKQCTSKPVVFIDRLSKSFGRGFITTNDPQWSNDRKIVNIAFNNKNLLSFIPIFNEETNRELLNIDKNIEEKSGKPLVVHFREFTARIATRTTIGRIVDKTHFSGKYFAESINEFLKYSVQMALNIFFIIPLVRNIARMTYFKNAVELIDIMKSLITESLNDYSTQRGVDPSYDININTAMEYMAKGAEQNKIKWQDVTDNIRHIFIGAFDTTSNTLYYIMLMLGMHPEYQQRAYEEVCKIFPNNDNEPFEVTHEHIKQMNYIDRIVKETMRLLPAVPQVVREVADHDLILSNGVILPKGQIVVIDVFCLHRSKEIWGPDAHKFNPDNFLPSNMEARHRYSYIPFSKGLRSCLGSTYAQLSIKVTLSKLIKRYKFNTKCKLEDLNLENHITSKLSVEPPVIVERR